MNKLNRKGLVKLLPFFEEIAEDLYSDDCEINIMILDDNLYIDAENPVMLMSEAEENGVKLEYVGKDRYSRPCFKAYVMEEQPLAGAGVPAPSPQSVSADKPMAAGRKESSGPEDQTKMLQQMMTNIMPQIQKQVEEMLNQWGKKMQDTLAKTMVR